MPMKRINQLAANLPFEQKIVVIGSLLFIISLILPWYQDLDSFKTGDMFLGITGPLYMAGWSLLLIMVLNISLIVAGSLNIKVPLNIKSSSIYLASGIAAFYMLILVNSIYFHPKFGVNITLKESQFGMFISFISASMLTIGGYLCMKDKQSFLREFREKAQESMITLKEQAEIRRPREIVRNSQFKIQTEVAPVQAEISVNEDGIIVPAQPSTSQQRKPYQSFRTDL